MGGGVRIILIIYTLEIFGKKVSNYVIMLIKIKVLQIACLENDAVLQFVTCIDLSQVVLHHISTIYVFLCLVSVERKHAFQLLVHWL